MARTDEYPEHLAEAAQAIDQLREVRQRQLPSAERAIQRLVERIARPRFVVGVAAAICVWVIANASARAAGHPFDNASYTLLSLIATLISLVLVFAVLSGQRTNNTLEQERARLMLQLLIVQDRKLTQALNAVEDLRHVDPRLPNPARGELHEETDIHAAASALQEVERQEGEGV